MWFESVQERTDNTTFLGIVTTFCSTVGEAQIKMECDDNVRVTFVRSEKSSKAGGE